jgi:hypothetical protein
VTDPARRVTYADIVPYETPSSLDALRGPTSGTVEVPVSIHHGPRRTAGLSTHWLAVATYQEVVRDGSTSQQESLLAKPLLLRLWPEIHLPLRCRRTWESKFPALAERRQPPPRQ